MARLAVVRLEIALFELRRLVLADLSVVTLPFVGSIINLWFLLKNTFELFLGFIYHPQSLERTLSRLQVLVIAFVRV